MTFSFPAILLVIGSFSVGHVEGQKALIISPGISGSQLIFYERCATTLQKSGFNVTLLVLETPKSRHYKGPSGIRTIKIDADPFDSYHAVEKDMPMVAFGLANMKPSQGALFMNFLSNLTMYVLKNHRTVVSQLKEEKFDIGYAFAYNYGATGLLEAMGIKTTVLLPSGNIADQFYWFMGVPTPWSYVPCVLTAYSDRMTFTERTKNSLCFAMFLSFSRTLSLSVEDKLFQETYGPSFPRLSKLIADFDMVMINSEEFIDLPRPILHKVQYIAGLGMKEASPVTQKWSGILDKGKKGAVLFSLGTVAKAQNMPDYMRKALFSAFKRFPDYQFIVRFEGRPQEGLGVRNIELADWVPQKDLLNDRRMKAFITHGGFNSMLESAKAGVPMVVLPLFGDQMGNARRVERAGVGVGIDKLELTEQIVYDAISTVLGEGYRQRAARLSRMIAKKPESPEDRLVKWSKFLAEFKSLDNLRPVSADLTFIEYFNLDVLAVVVVGLVVALYVAAKITKFVLGKLFVALGGKRKRE